MNKLLTENEKPDISYLITGFIGGDSTDSTHYQLLGALEQGFPFAVTELNTEYLVAHYDPTPFAE